MGLQGCRSSQILTILRLSRKMSAKDLEPDTLFPQIPRIDPGQRLPLPFGSNFDTADLNPGGDPGWKQFLKQFCESVGANGIKVELPFPAKLDEIGTA